VTNRPKPKAATAANARKAIPGLKEPIMQFNTDGEKGLFPKVELHNMRNAGIENAIRAIESAPGQPEVRSIPPGKSK
jgi:hypothetical protein